MTIVNFAPRAFAYSSLSFNIGFMTVAADELTESPGLYRSASALVVEGVTELIARGTLGSGSIVPSERSLAAHFKVNRKAVRRALMLLATNGVVQSHGPRARTVAPAAAGRITAARRVEAVRSQPFVRQCMVILAPEVHDDRRGFMTAITNGVAAGVRAAGYDGISVHPNKVTGGLIDSSVMELLQARPAGLLLPEMAGQQISSQLLRTCHELKIPTVVYGSAPELAGNDRVVSDHDRGSYQLTQWLIERGCKRILQIAPSTDSYWYGHRRGGYERAVNEAGLSTLPDEQIIVRGIDKSEWTEQFFAEATRHTAGYLFPFLMKEHPADAIMALTDSNANQIIAACQFLGKQPHRDVVVVGYDNYWAYSPDASSIDRPVAATIDKLNFEAGMEMVKLLMQRINGELPVEPVTRVLDPQLVVVDDGLAVSRSV